MSGFLQTWLSCLGVRYGLQCSKCTHLVEACRGRNSSGGACHAIYSDSIDCFMSLMELPENTPENVTLIAWMTVY